jgi:hypothetical protein
MNNGRQFTRSCPVFGENNMFDLEQAITEWRQQMLAAGIKTPVPLEELENHLREDIERQMKSGLDAEKAFGAAIQRIGQAHALENEFKKVGGTKEERKQKFIRIYFVIFPVFYSALCLYGLLKIEMSPALRILGFAAVALTTLFIWSAPHIHKHLPMVRNKKVKISIQIGGIVAWMICAGVFMNFILPRLNLTESQLVVTVLWLMMPAAVLANIGYGFCDVARRQTAMASM